MDAITIILLTKIRWIFSCPALYFMAVTPRKLELIKWQGGYPTVLQKYILSITNLIHNDCQSLGLDQPDRYLALRLRHLVVSFRLVNEIVERLLVHGQLLSSCSSSHFPSEANSVSSPRPGVICDGWWLVKATSPSASHKTMEVILPGVPKPTCFCVSGSRAQAM